MRTFRPAKSKSEGEGTGGVCSIDSTWGQKENEVWLRCSGIKITEDRVVAPRN